MLDIKIDKIEYLATQNEIDESFINHGVRLDVYVKDSKRIFDVEIQTTNSGNLLKRARYYQSMIDIDQLKKGNDYESLKESYVLFICTFDPFEKKLYKYSFQTICKELNEPQLNDKTYKIFYNIRAFEQSQNKNVQAFLKFLATKEATSAFTKSLEKAVYDAKGRDKWRARYMTLGMKFKEYEEKGATQKAIETARLSLQNNLQPNLIAKITGLSLAEIEKLKEQIKQETLVEV